MASPTIDPLIRIKPSEKLTKIVSYIVEIENKKSGDSNNAPPTAIASLLKQIENISSDFTFSIEDIKWIYDRKEILTALQNKPNDSGEMDWIR